MNLKQKKKMLSALLAFTMVLQMSVPLVFAEGEDSSSGADDIMLSGSNQPTTTGGAITIDLDGLVAGDLDSLNEGDIVTIDGKEVTYKGDATATGINIAQSDYIADGKQVIYKAGNGYILITWPTQAGNPYLVTLHDANIDIAGTGDIDAIDIVGKVIMTLEGANSLKAPRDGIRIGTIQPIITIGGNGNLYIESLCGINQTYISGEFIIQEDAVLDLRCTGFGMHTGYSGKITIKDNAKVNISVSPGINNAACICKYLYVKGNAEVNTNGEHPIIDAVSTEVEPTTSLNAIVRGVLSTTEWPHTIYGTVTVPENAIVDLGAEYDKNGPFSAAEGASLINNGVIKFKDGVSVEQLKALNITNNGILMLGRNPVQLFGDTLYEDRGEIAGDFDFKTNITTEPTYYRKSGGYIMFRPASGVENAVLTLHGVNLEEYNDLLILPDEQVDVILEGENKADIIEASKNFNLKGNGTLNALRIETTEENVQMNIGSDVKLNSEYRTVSNMIMTSTFYGKNEVAYQGGLVVRDDQKVVLKSGSELKLLGQGFMQIEEGSLGDIIIEEGAYIVNNSHIFLPIGTTIEQIKAFNLKGAGVVRVVKEYDNGLPSIWDTFSNEGKSVTVINGNLTLDDIEITESDNKGYTWTKTEESGNEVWTLTLENVNMSGNIVLNDKKTIILIKDDVTINGNIVKNDSNPTLNLEIKGDGVLNVNSISGGNNNDKLVISSGITLNVAGNIFMGGSGGEDGAVIVDGAGTILNINTSFASGIGSDTVKILNGANAKIHSEDKGVMALTGGVSVENGSTLETNCEYGVYILDGKLYVDDTSILITDGSIAPFGIVDKSGTKVESDVVRLPGMPTDTKINSVTGDFDFYGTYRKYWSVTHDTGVLGVTDENSEPVKLTGAAIGRYIFKKAVAPTDPTPTTPTTPSTPSDGGGGSSSNNDKKDSEKSSTSITPITIVKAEQTNPTFIDVNDSDWFKPAVDFVTGKGIMNGVEKNRFGPNISTTRGMIVTIFWQMENKPMPNDSQNYADVNQEQYFADAVNWATENNIVVGYGNGNFGPDDIITREQMATILYQYCKYKNYDLNQGGMSTREFNDYENISPWALEYMTWAVNNQIISGVGNNMLNSRGHATRAQVAAILKNFYAIIDKQ
ncbi:S-layer homology domain-containing protein [Acetoanaerobium sticklandii]|uniref:S-layer homology domain-containing protein n=1 Tax=Acetoanaerobium sticklandii TaxID=1511 RepID=UPI003A8D9837